MIRRKASRRIPDGGRLPEATIASEARAKRARDHLARKRRQERQRIQRERGRAATAGSRARKRGLLTPLLFLFAFASGLVLAPSLSEFFFYRGSPVKRVAVQGSSALTAYAIAQSLDIQAGESLDTVDAAKIRDAIISEPWIESIRSLRLPNGTLIVSVVEREAVARWLASESADVSLIDDRGERFAARVGPGGPLPLVLGKIADGKALPMTAIEILEELRRHVVLAKDPTELTLHLPVLEGTGKGAADDRDSDMQSGYVLQIGEDGPRALLGKSSHQQRIARLAALLDSEESRLKGVRLIDLRYADRAVLQTEPASG